MSVENSVGIRFRRGIVTQNNFKAELVVRKIPYDRRAGVVSFFCAVENSDAFVAVFFPSFDDVAAYFANGVLLYPVSLIAELYQLRMEISTSGNFSQVRT